MSKVEVNWFEKRWLLVGTTELMTPCPVSQPYANLAKHLRAVVISFIP